MTFLMNTWLAQRQWPSSSFLLQSHFHNKHCLWYMAQSLFWRVRLKMYFKVPFLPSFLSSGLGAFAALELLSSIVLAFSSCMASSPMTIVWPFDISQFTDTSPSETEARRTEPTLTVHFKAVLFNWWYMGYWWPFKIWQGELDLTALLTVPSVSPLEVATAGMPMHWKQRVAVQSPSPSNEMQVWREG